MQSRRIKNRFWVLWGTLGTFLFLTLCPMVCEWSHEIALRAPAHDCCPDTEKSKAPAEKNRCCETGHPDLYFSKLSPELPTISVVLPIWLSESVVYPEAFIDPLYNNRAPPRGGGVHSLYLIKEAFLI